MTEREFNLYS